MTDSLEGAPVARPRLVLAIVATAAFILSVDLTFVNVALPQIGARFGATVPQLAWVVDAYTVALTSLLIPGAAVAERFGRRGMFLAGMALFGAASLVGGLAMSLGVLLLARVLMGVGAGMMLAPAMAITAMAFAPAERTRALATWASAGALGLALGPVLGGIVVGTFGWRWAFLLPVPVLAVALVAGARVLPRGRGPAGVPFDLPGTVLALVALVPLIAALIEAPRLGWSSPWVVGLLAVGLLLLLAFAVREATAPAPAFDVRALARTSVGGASLVLFASYVAFMGVLFLVTIDLQVVAGLGPIAYGLVLVPMAVAYWVMSRVAARVTTTSSRGAGACVLTGLVALVGAFAIPAADPSTVPWALVALVLMGIGNGLAVPVSAALVLNARPGRSLGTASALSVVARFAGGAVGVALIASAAASAASLDAGLTRGYWAGAITVLALGAAGGALLLRGGGVGEGRPIEADRGSIDPGPG